MNDVFTGNLVRLAAYDPEEMSKAFSRWNRNSEYSRLLNSSSGPLQSPKRAAKWMEEEMNKLSPASYYFSIRTKVDDRLIGELGLDVVDWCGREAFVGLGIGEPEYWSKGYGTEAMNILLRFAFTELNLKRVTLTVFEYNPRAIRSYEKAGFKHEGRQRQFLHRNGKRWDVLEMGILREEWLKFNKVNPQISQI